MTFDEETEDALDEYVEEVAEARRETTLIYYEGCTVVTAPVGPPPEYITVAVDDINDPNVHWRGVPPLPAIGDELLVWENPISHRREILCASGATGVTGGGSWCQQVVVAKCGGDFDDISDAITWINALAAGPAANRLFVLWVLAGNYTEAANVTIPAYVYMIGQYDGTELDLTNAAIQLSADSGLANITVTSTGDTGNVMAQVLGNNAVMRNVRFILTGAGNDGLQAGSYTGAELHHIIFEATAACGTAAYFDGTTALLWDCKADDTTYWGTAALYLDGGANVTTKFCEFRAASGGDDVLTIAGTSWYHLACNFDPNNSTIAAGTHTALPTKRFNQEVIVAEEGGDFQALSEAVTWINAQADAAAGKRYGVSMMAGNYAEAGAVTIPSYVGVEGKGEATRIEMAGNQLNMSDDSYLADVVAVFTSGNGLVADDADCLLWHVKSINDGDYCFRFMGDSVAEATHCIAETTSGCNYGFQIRDTAIVTMHDCVADGNFTLAALVLANSVCKATTRYCVFHGVADDVWTGVASTWDHIKCEYDVNNSTIGGTETALTDGAVEIFSTDIRSHNSLFPDLGTTTLAEKWGDVFLGTDKDVYARDDGGGLFQRAPNHWRTPTDHFNAFAGYTWAAYAPFDGAPSTVNVATFPSLLYLINDDTTEDHYAYQAATASIYARLSKGVSSYIGIRIQDSGNDDNDFTELRLIDGTTTGFFALQIRYQVGGGGVTTTTLVDDIEPGFYLILLVKAANTVYAYYTMDTPIPVYIGSAGGMTWTLARAGIIFGQRVATGGDQSGFVDFVEIS